MNSLKQDCLSIIDSWIRKSKNKTQLKEFMTIQDHIMNDLEYTRTNEAKLKMSEYLEKGNQENEELILIRKYLCL